MKEKKILPRRNFLYDLFVGGSAALVVSACGGSGGGSTPQPLPPDPVIVDPPEPSEKYKGITVTSWWHNDYSGLHIDNTLNIVKGMNANTVCIVPTQYVNSPSSPDIFVSPIKTPADVGIESILAQAKAKGMRTVLKPHIDPLSGWRGQINFSNEADWITFFANYKDMVLHYAAIAASHDVDVYSVGTELKGTTQREADWRQVINDVKGIFDKKLIYAANWDNYQNIPFWDALDYIGVDAYFPLTGIDNPTQAELDQAMTSVAQGIEIFSQNNNKKILITEMGYQSYNGTNMSPWSAPTWTPDMQEQDMCFKAALNTLLPKDYIDGVVIWDMHHDLRDLDGFAVQGKPAEQTVRNEYGIDYRIK